MPEGEEEEQEIENLFEYIMKEDFPNLAKEIDFQEIQGAHWVPKKLNPRRNTPRYIIIKSAKIKDKESILKSSRGKERVTYKGVPIRLFSQKKSYVQEEAGKKYLKFWKARTYIQVCSIHQSNHLKWKDI